MNVTERAIKKNRTNMINDEVAIRKEGTIQKKGSGRQKASEECPWRNIRDKHIL